MKIKIVLGLLTVFAVSAFLTNGSASAVSGKCYFTTGTGPVKGSGGGTCSVKNLGAYGTNDVLTGRSTSGNGSAIPRSINTKSEFISFLRARFNSSNQHDQVGAAFIIQEMRGSTAWPSTAAVNDWVDRMNNSDVTVKSEWDGSVGRTSWFDDEKDNTFYANHPNVGRQVINVYYKGKLRAQIEHLCGNMVAGSISLTSNPRYSLSVDTTTPRSTVSVGDTITWTHTDTNAGPNTAGRTNWRIYTRYDGKLSSTSGSFSKITKGSHNHTRKLTATAAMAGKTYCQFYRVWPRSSSSNSTITSPQRCVKVASDYELTPSLAGDSGVFESGSIVSDVSATVGAAGTMASDEESAWWFGVATIPPGDKIPGAGKDGREPADYYSSDGLSPSAIDKLDDGSRRFTGDTRVAQDRAPQLDDLPTGTKVCWLLAVKPPSNDYSGWLHATPLCITIGKKPKLRVLGGDVRAGGSIQTSTSIVNKNGLKTFGSWVEFGALSVGDNIGFASGASLRSGDPSPSQSSWSDLTFANTSATVPAADESQFGHYNSNLPAMPDLRNYFEARTKNAFSSGSLSGKSGVYSAGNITITGSNNINQTVVIVSTGTVKVNGNITLDDGAYNSLGDLPQVVIIARNIEIDDSVTRVDAWLVSDGWVNTCSAIDVPTVSPTGTDSSTDPASGKLNAGVCDKTLRINGPVIAERLYLYRTSGSEGVSDIAETAETINLRPDAYLWAYDYGLKFAQPDTLSVEERPPRY